MANRDSRTTFETVASDDASRIVEEVGRALAVASPDGVILVTEPGIWRVAFINDAALGMFPGQPARVGAELPDFFDPGVAQDLRGTLDRVRLTSGMADITVTWKSNP